MAGVKGRGHHGGVDAVVHHREEAVLAQGRVQHRGLRGRRALREVEDRHRHQGMTFRSFTNCVV